MHNSSKRGQPSGSQTVLYKHSLSAMMSTALTALHESLPGPEYPLYVTSDPPVAPDGLHVELSDGAATLTWGEILGVTEYRLYARAAGTGEFRILARAVNGNGEGPKSRTAGTNPASWRGWDPRPGESFRRAYSLSPDSPSSPNTESAYYPH
jgi:hypothetical protein